jgi:hypothetical protein
VSKNQREQATWKCEIMFCLVNHYQFLCTNYVYSLVGK